MRRNGFALASLLLFHLFSFLIQVCAQTTTSGGLTGVVTDPSGALVPGAVVEIRDTAKGTIQTTKTDQEGAYHFFFLAPGRYALTVTHEGIEPENRAVEVLLGPPVSVNVALKIARENTSVNVTAEAPLIHAENGDVSATVNQKQISEVPNPGNDLGYIPQTTPGAVMNTETQGFIGFSILGMPGNSYQFTIDGMNQNDNGENLLLQGSLGLTLGQNQIQEATVVSTGYSGQFGGSAGGNINYITKSGSNEVHGNAQYYWNGRVLNANDWFNNAFGLPRPFDIANQWAGSLGGPLKKNKLFFFFDTEGVRVLIPQGFLLVIPTPEFEAATMANIESKFGTASASSAFYRKMFDLYKNAPGANRAVPNNLVSTDPLGCAGFADAKSGLGITVPCSAYNFSFRSQISQDSLVSGRVDWNFNRDDRASLRLQSENGHAAGADAISPAFDTDSKLPWRQGQFNETHTFGTSAASQFLLGGSYWAPFWSVGNPSRAFSTFPTTLAFGAGPFSTLGGADNWSNPGFGRAITMYQISEDVMKTRGNHKFGFGASFDRTYWTFRGYTINATGNLLVQTVDAFFQGGVDLASPDVDSTVLSQSFPSATSQRLAFYNLALYSQDEWHARPNLTLTLTLRAEHKSNPVCKLRCFSRLAGSFDAVSHDPNQPYSQAIVVHQRQGLRSLDSVLWSPRFSFAWQPFDVSRNTVIRGGAGIFYDPVPAFAATSASNNSPLWNSYVIGGDNLAPDETTSLFKTAAASNATFLQGFASGKTLAEIQAINPGFAPPGFASMEARMHLPQYQRWSLEWQQAVGVSASVSVGYFGNHGIHELVEDFNANAYGFGSLPAKLCSSPPVPPCADPRFGQVMQVHSAAVSNYNGMVVSFRQGFNRWGAGLFQANYTYGHTLDEVSNGGDSSFTGGSFRSPQDYGHLREAYGPAEYDVRHSFNANYLWELPIKAILRGHGAELVVTGWQVSGTIFSRTGFPYTVFDYTESSSLAVKNYGGLIYAVPAGPLGPAIPCGEGAALPAAPKPCQTPQILPDGVTPNANARFIQAGCETGFNTGNLPGPTGPCDGPSVTLAQGRNRFRGLSFFDTDFSITKNTKLPHWEGAMLGIGFQFFNFFNHPNFGLPDHSTSLGSFGMIGYTNQTSSSLLGNGVGGDNAPRMIQLKAQLRF
jgi:hypothetical protein